MKKSSNRRNRRIAAQWNQSAYPFRQCRGSEVGRTLAGATRASLRRLTPVEAGSPFLRVAPPSAGVPIPGMGVGRRSGRPWWLLVSSLNATNRLQLALGPKSDSFTNSELR